MISKLPILAFAATWLLSQSNSLASEIKLPPLDCNLKESIPSDYVCGTRGRTGHKYHRLINIGSPRTKVKSLDECAAICLRRRPYFGTFVYDTDDKSCALLYPDFVSSLNFVKDDNSSKIFSETRCYECPPSICPQESEVSVVENGDFEYSSDFAGPWVIDSANGYDNGKYYSIVHPGSRGSANALRCGPKHGPASGCFLQQRYQPCEGTTYVLQFDWKYPRQKKGYITDLDASVANLGWHINILQNGSDGVFKTEQLYFKEPFIPFEENGILQIKGEYPLQLDNIQIYPIIHPRYVLGAPNIIQNGDFETGSIEPWHVNQDPYNMTSVIATSDINDLSEIGLSGSLGTHIFQWYTPAKYVSNEVKLRQRFDTVPGKRYLATFDYAVVTDGYFSMRVYFSERGLPRASRVRDLQYSVGLNGYNYNTLYRFQLPYAATASKTELKLELEYYQRDKSSAYIYIDNVDFRELE